MLEIEPTIFRLASLALRLLASSPRRVLTLSPLTLTRPTTHLYSLSLIFYHRPEQLPATLISYSYLLLRILTPFPDIYTLFSMYPNLRNIFVRTTDTRSLTTAPHDLSLNPQTSCWSDLREPRLNLLENLQVAFETSSWFLSFFHHLFIC